MVMFTMAKTLTEKIADWYRGKYVPPPENDPNSSAFLVSGGHYEQSLLANAIRILATFWLDHWKWIITSLIAITLAVLGLFYKK
jgi:hypothetical protein